MQYTIISFNTSRFSYLLLVRVVCNNEQCELLACPGRCTTAKRVTGTRTTSKLLKSAAARWVGIFFNTNISGICEFEKNTVYLLQIIFYSYLGFYRAYGLCCVTAPTSKKSLFFSRNVEKSPAIDHGMCSAIIDMFCKRQLAMSELNEDRLLWTVITWLPVGGKALSSASLYVCLFVYVFVCLSACMSKFQQIFCTCYLFGSSLVLL